MSRIRPLIVAAIVTMLACASAFGQQSPGGSLAARPDRGATPGGAFSVSEFDSISLTGGGLNLSIPLASLPPIAGGKLGVTLTATYNSKLWNVARREVRAPTPLGLRTYVVDEPQLSDRAGWSISGPGYDIVFRNTREDFGYYVPQQNETDATDWVWIDRQWWRAYLVTPDGAEHELTPTDPATTYGGTTRTYLIGSYAQTPKTINAPMRYHTTDGTYLNVIAYPDGAWVVTSPDGTKVTRSVDGSQRIRDANGNSVRIYNNGDGVTHYADEQTGRELRVTATESVIQVWYQAVGGSWQHVDVNFGTTRVRGKVYTVNDWNSSARTETGQDGDTCVRDAVLDRELRVVREIVFPVTEPGKPGRRFSFEYNSDTAQSFTTDYREMCGLTPEPRTFTSSNGLGELSRMMTPPGAHTDYSYSQTSTHRFVSNIDDITRDFITARSLTHEGVTDTWTYNVAWHNGGGSVTGPDGSVSSEAAYLGDPAYGFQSGSSNGMAGRVYRSISGNVLTERRWALPYPNALRAAPSGFVAINPVVEAEFTSLVESGVTVLTSARTHQYDVNGNLLRTKEYDWFKPQDVQQRDPLGIPVAPPANARLLRQTATSYYNSAPDISSVNYYAARPLSGSTLVINAPRESVTGESRTRFSYDNQAYGAAPTAGNVTSVSSFDDQGDADAANDRWVITTRTYDGYGNVSTATDANGHVTQFFFEDATHVMPTRIVVDPLNGTGPQTTTTTYDFWTGLVTSATDANGQVSTIDYTNQLLGAVDPLGRPGVVTGPPVSVNGVTQRRKTFTTYEDSARRVTVESDLNTEGDRLLKKRITTDQLEHPVLVEQSEDGSTYTISAQTLYEQMGRITFASNPMRVGTAATTDGWTRTIKDAFGRVIEVATFSGAQRPAATTDCTAAAGCTGKVKTEYYAEFTTITDQAGKVRRTRSDAAGRLVRADEPGGETGLLGDYENPAQPTAYAYDTLGNLVTVRQGGQIQNGQYVGGQTRSFMYSTLSRLASVTNPEVCQQQLTQCTPVPVTYSYDPAGNLKRKVDARGFVTTYNYDALGRVTSRGYTDGTPSVAYFYDTQQLPEGAPSFDRGMSVGKLLAVTYGGGALGSYVGGYDTLGRPRLSKQVTDAGAAEGVKTYAMAYAYDFAGNIISEQYPSGRVVETKYDTAGRLAGVKNQGGDYYAGGDPNVANNPEVVQYAAHGGASVVRLGNGLWEHTNFNSRLQATQIGLGVSSTSNSILQLDYSFGTTSNNGNVLSQKITISGAAGFTQTFTYDSLNRLDVARETRASDGGQSWQQRFAYDSFGNRTVNAAETTDNVEGPSLSINAANNRILTVGYSYDMAGNLTADPNHTYEFDADNRLKANDAGGNPNVATTYVYDGDGRRVRKATANGLTTIFVYSVAGHLLAEYSNQATDGGRSYLTADSLGSTRVVTSQDQGVKERYDYLPFGDGLYVERSQQGYSGGDTRQKFTSKERDNETGLDFFTNRYYAPTQGRFTSPDPTILSVRATNPQTLNRYAYVLNNPLRFVDPFGLWEWDYQDTLDDKGKLIRRKVIFKKTKDDDNAESLLNQLGYKKGTKEGDKLLKSIEKQLEKGETVHGAELAGVVGRVFKIADKGLTAQARGPLTENGGPRYSEYNDCSQTTFKAATPAQTSQYGGPGQPVFDVESGDELLAFTTNLKPGDPLRAGDIVRYGKDDMRGGRQVKNAPTHFMSFIFTRDDGTQEAFSRTGENGRFEIVRVDQFNGGDYGKIQGKGGHKTGFYRPQF